MPFEVGKTYQTRDGRIVTTIHAARFDDGTEYVVGHDHIARFAVSGQTFDQNRDADLVQHPTKIAGLTPVQMAEVIGDLRYDALNTFLGALATKLLADSDADAARGRPLLAEDLRLASVKLDRAREHIWSAWDISAPHMTADK